MYIEINSQYIIRENMQLTKKKNSGYNLIFMKKS